MINNSAMLWTLKVLLFTLLVAFWYLGQNIYLANSEIWAINVSQLSYLESLKHPELLYKFIFHLFLKFGYFLEFDSPNLFLFNRALFSFIATVNLFFVYKISLTLFRSPMRALLVVIITLTTSLFLLRGYRVRSDHLAMGFHLLAVWMLFKRKPLGIVALFELLAFLTTPKSIGLIVSLLIFIFVWHPPKKAHIFAKLSTSYQWAKAKWYLVLSFFMSCGLFLYYGYRAPLEYFIHSFGGWEQSVVPYFSKQSFMYYLRFATDNFWYVILVLISLIWFLYPSLQKYRIQSSLRRAWLAKTWVLLAWALVLPDKLPFFLASLLPLFSLTAMIVCDDVYNLIIKQGEEFMRYLRVALFLSVVTLTARTFIFGLDYLRLNNNHEQVQAIYDLKSYFAQFPQANYFDGTGIIPQGQQVIEYVGYGEAQYRGFVFERIKQDPPDFILYTGYVSYFGEPMRVFLRSNYVHLGNELWGKGFYPHPNFKWKHSLFELFQFDRDF